MTLNQCVFDRNHNFYVKSGVRNTMLNNSQIKGVEHICVATVVLTGFMGLISTWVAFVIGGCIYLLSGFHGYGDHKWYSVASSLVLGCLLISTSMLKLGIYTSLTYTIRLSIFVILMLMALYLIWSGISD